MPAELIAALASRRSEIHDRWERLLRADKAGSPLGSPDALVHLINWTLAELERALRGLPTRRRPPRPLGRGEFDCPCGQNPLLVYFAAGEQALQESLILAQSARSGLTPLERDAELGQLNLALRHLARRETGAFCALCQLRGRGCRGEAPAAVPA